VYYGLEILCYFLFPWKWSKSFKTTQ
jgi:hypothetical protein